MDGRNPKSGAVVATRSMFHDRLDTDEGRAVQEWNIAQMLSGYDTLTWNKLSTGRRQTYLRAARGAIFNSARLFEEIKKLTGGC